MPFYAIGKIYKKVEKYDKLNNTLYFSIILLIQLVVLQKFGNIKYNLNILTFKYNYIVYFISSMIGIMFWLNVINITTGWLGNFRISTFKKQVWYSYN